MDTKPTYDFEFNNAFLHHIQYTIICLVFKISHLPIKHSIQTLIIVLIYQ